MLASTSATNGARSPTSAVIQVASPVAANSDTTGKSDNSYSAPRLTSRQVPPTTPSRRGNSHPWFGTLRGRAGYAINNVLLFASAGLAYGNLTANLAGLEESKTLVGWAGGLGMEVGFTPNWTAKVEYLYMDLGSRFCSVTGVDNGLQSSYLRLGVNYHF